jgi:hypothetical protein
MSRQVLHLLQENVVVDYSNSVTDFMQIIFLMFEP